MNDNQINEEYEKMTDRDKRNFLLEIIAHLETKKVNDGKLSELEEHHLSISKLLLEKLPPIQEVEDLEKSKFVKIFGAIILNYPLLFLFDKLGFDKYFTGNLETPSVIVICLASLGFSWKYPYAAWGIAMGGAMIIKFFFEGKAYPYQTNPRNCGGLIF